MNDTIKKFFIIFLLITVYSGCTTVRTIPPKTVQIDSPRVATAADIPLYTETDIENQYDEICFISSSRGYFISDIFLVLLLDVLISSAASSVANGSINELKAVKELKQKAFDVGADAVVKLKIYRYGGSNVCISGVAVRYR